MLKKIFIKGICVSLILAMAIFFVSSTHASDAGAIVTISSEKVSPNENFYLVLNISAITYEKFQVDITNNQSIRAIETTGTVGQLASNNVATTFVIDKSQLGLEKLGIVYTAPQTEGTINFNVKITSLESTQSDLTTQIESLNTELGSLQSAYDSLVLSISSVQDTTSETYTEAVNQKEELSSMIEAKTTEKNQLEVNLANYVTPSVSASASIQVSTDVEKTHDMEDMKNSLNESIKETDKEKEADEMGDKSKNMKEMENMKDKMKEMEDMSDDMKSKMSSLESSLKTAKDTISSLSADTTYQGSPNNYLSALVVDGHDLNNVFDKTTNDYFITVDDGTTKINVTAAAEDFTATVTTYGNTDLKMGKNKVIINVTAQDGSVRTYRIYVTKQ